MKFHARWSRIHYNVDPGADHEAWSSSGQESLNMQLALLFAAMAALAFQVLSAGVKAGWL